MKSSTDSTRNSPSVWEEEIAQRVERYGDIAQVFSWHEETDAGPLPARYSPR